MSRPCWSLASFAPFLVRNASKLQINSLNRPTRPRQEGVLYADQVSPVLAADMAGRSMEKRPMRHLHSFAGSGVIGERDAQWPPPLGGLGAATLRRNGASSVAKMKATMMARKASA